MSNLSENRIDLELDPADFQVMQDNINGFINLLPAGTTLTDQQRNSYSAINVSNKVFAEDVLSESYTLGPDILPAYVKLEALERDLSVFSPCQVFSLDSKQTSVK